MKRILPLALTAIMFISLTTKAQITVTFKPDSDVGKDAEIVDQQPNLNINDNKLSPYAWTHSGQPVTHRSMIEFTQLSTIPPSSIIVSAKLKLYFKTNHPANPGNHSGVNDLYVRRITAPWTETGVTWNNQPTTSSINEVLVPPSSANNQDYVIDVTNLVVDIRSSNNNGFMLSLQNESPYRLALFASSDHTNTALHPELEIVYNYPTSVANHLLSSLKIYPNPVSTKILNIESPKTDKSFNIEILNCLGQTVAIEKLQSSKTTLDVSQLTSGTYFIKIRGKDSYSNNSKKITIL